MFDIAIAKRSVWTDPIGVSTVPQHDYSSQVTSSLYIEQNKLNTPKEL